MWCDGRTCRKADILLSARAEADRNLKAENIFFAGIYSIQF
jgi:hypothetical protein